MTDQFTEELREQITGLVADVKEAKGSAEKAGRDLDGRVKKIDDDLSRYGQELSETKDAFQKQSVAHQELLDEHKELTQKLAALGSQASPGGRKTLGDLAVESDVIKGYREGTVLPRSEILVDHEKSAMGLVEQVKAVTGAGGSGGPLVQTDTRPGILTEPDQPLRIRDLLTVLPTSFYSVEWMKELVFTNSAATVAEGAAKPESDITFALETTNMKVVAHWLAATNQILADVPRLRAFIDQRLTYGLKYVEEQQLLNGDGTGENLTGLIPAATDYANDASVGADAGDTALDKLRRAILQAELAGYPADAIVMHPTNWANIELMKTSDNAYLFTNPQSGATPVLWGRRVVTSRSMAVDTYLTGGIQLGATLYDREQMSVQVATQHADYFTRNMVAILCEERIGLAVERPAALITGSLAAA